MTTIFDRTTHSSEKAIETLRESLAAVVPAGVVALTCGSYARREATVGSDLDFYVIEPSTAETGGPNKPAWFQRAEEAIFEVVRHRPADGGAFGNIISRDELLKNFGGDQDTNQSITRRMLYLLEGEFLANGPEFAAIRHRILEQYISESREDHHIAQYLLNDVIRYWRTITVDYAFKTQEASKPWAIRNIKLVFSRKLLYASGLFSVAMTADRTQEAKMKILEHLFSMSPLERIKDICGANNVQALLRSYGIFLERLDDPDVRRHLNILEKKNRDEDKIFRELKNEGYRFAGELLMVYEKTFHSTHPIRRAVIF